MRASTWPGRAQPVIWSRISLCLPFSSTAVTETSRQVRKTPRPVSCSPPMLLATLSGVVGPLLASPSGGKQCRPSANKHVIYLWDLTKSEPRRINLCVSQTRTNIYKYIIMNDEPRRQRSSPLKLQLLRFKRAPYMRDHVWQGALRMWHASYINLVGMKLIIE
jgi:hypothetical protein